MGVRTKTERVVVTRTNAQYSCSGLTNVTSSFVVSSLSTRSGGSNPMYQNLISNGVNATNSLTGVRRSFEFTNGAHNQRVKRRSCLNYGKSITSSHCGWGPVYAAETDNSSLLASAKNKAAIAFRQNYQEKISAFGGLTALGELRETISMIKRPAQSISKLLNGLIETASIDAKKPRTRAYRRKRSKYYAHLRGTPGVVADSWLEFNFGLAPLMNDITNFANAAGERMKMNSRARIVGSGDAETSITSALDFGTYKYQLNRISKAKGLFRGAINLTYPSHEGVFDSIASSAVYYGISYRDIIPTAWELLPWSFFIDYFSNVGDCINANLVSLSDLAWSSYTDILENTAIMDGGYPTQSDILETISFVSPKTKSTYRLVRRQPSPVPFGQVRFELPGSNIKLLNIAALLTSVNFSR